MTADVQSMTGQSGLAYFGPLLRSIVPRADSFSLYDLTGNCVWRSDAAENFELDNFVSELPPEILNGSDPEAVFFRRTLPSGRTALLLAVTTSDSRGLGVFVALFSRNAGKASWFNPDELKNILAPTAGMLGESVELQHSLQQSAKRTQGAELELQLVYKLDQKIHSASRSHTGLAQLVSQSGRFLGIAYSVLLMPGKRIRVSATHSSWQEVDRKAIDKSLLQSLIPQLDGQHEPVIFEVPPAENPSGPAEFGYQVMLCPILDAAGNVEGALAQVGRISGESFTARHLRFMSHIARKAEYVITQSFDPMTGLMNRSGFEAQLQESMLSMDASSHLQYMLHFDLDNLQLINDTFGHSAGDDVIKRFAQMIESELPAIGVAARLNADEFSVLLTETSLNGAKDFADLIRKKTDQLRYLQGDKSLQVTASVGIAELSPGENGGTNALRDSRIACKVAKEHGRDRVEISDNKNQSLIRRHDDMQLVTDIQKALDSDALELYAQPIDRLAPGPSVPYCEILLRMRDASGNIVPSGALFSAAERYQLMPQIDRWVVSTTLSSLQAHMDFLTSTGAIFAVNLSGQSLGDDNLRCFIEEEIEASGIPPGALCFEITESAAVANHLKAQSFIDSLRKYGCKFSLDDFGAGLSSFAYLKTFKVDTLKIDGSFIVDITENRISESMVAAITQVAKVMKLETVAEFVENNKTKNLLRDIGVTYAQGFGVGRPAPLAATMEVLMGKSKAS